jgi:hypothetical protein
VTGISSASGKLCQKNEPTKYDQPPKPVALLIGTSNISGINEEKLTPDVEVVKHMKSRSESRSCYISCFLSPSLLETRAVSEFVDVTRFFSSFLVSFNISL